MKPCDRFGSLIIVTALFLGLNACSSKHGSLRDQIGSSRQGPDEMMVIKRDPLKRPTGVTLPKPRAGAASLVDPQPELMAKQALLGTGVTEVSTVKSLGEQALLASANVKTDPQVRAKMRAEQAASESNKRLLDDLLHNPSANADILDADAEAQRLGLKIPPKK